MAYRALAGFVAAALWPFVRIESDRMHLAATLRSPVVVTNHRSLFDVAVGLVAFHRIKRYPRVLVAANWFDHPVTGRLLGLAGALPLDRTNPSVHYRAAHRVLEAGIPVLILPEGKLAGDPADPTSVGTFKTGAARLAAACDAVIYPLGIVGADRVWPRGARFPRLNPLRRRRVLLLGADEAVTVNGDARESTAEISAAVQALLLEAVERHPDY